LEPHEDSHSEYAVTGVVNGEVVRGLVDRTFIDNGVRWIIDFKTSEHEGGGMEEFLDEQQRRYRDQMERYARILGLLGNPVRLGLYFPLLDEWREWSPEQTSDAGAPG
jgi:ATP-dependent exoDNAse (exonuclease V) beta subunit